MSNKFIYVYFIYKSKIKRIMSMKNIEYIGPDEMIFSKNNDGDIYSGGFSVSSILIKAGLSPIMTLNARHSTGDQVSDMFEDLVIPNWVLSYHTPEKLISCVDEGSHQVVCEDVGKNNYRTRNTDVIDDELYDKLLELVMDHNSARLRAKRRATKKVYPQKSNTKTNAKTTKKNIK